MEATLIHRRPAIPNWATGFGQDGYGYFAEFSIQTGEMYFDFVCQKMRWIPPGEFQMGSPESEHGHRDDETLHAVKITKGFWMADTTCSQELWSAVMKENPSHFQGDRFPVEQVSFDDVQMFLERVNDQTEGLDLSLPSEAQWGYACRAGVEGTPFSFGEDVSTNQCNFDGNYPYKDGQKGEFRERTVPVESFRPNRWGLFQMHGNVWEWCSDWYGDYPDDTMSDTDPKGPPSGFNRVVRGGGWFNHAMDVRSANRNVSDPEFRNSYLGFRCVTSANQ